jgi:hypothetical protein
MAYISTKEQFAASHIEVHSLKRINEGHQKIVNNDFFDESFTAPNPGLNSRHIQEHVLPLHDLIMLNSAVSSVQHQITLR